MAHSQPARHPAVRHRGSLPDQCRHQFRFILPLSPALQFGKRGVRDHVPPGSLVLGSPAKVVRTLSLDEQAKIKGWAEKYVRGSRIYLERK